MDLERQLLQTPVTYEEHFPPAFSPPLVPPGSGSKVLEAKESVQALYLDSGAFRAVWELLEAEAKHRFPTHETLSGTRALLRAVADFRTAYWATHEVPDPGPVVKPSRLVRRGRDAPGDPPLSLGRPASPDGRRHVIPRKSVGRQNNIKNP